MNCESCVHFKACIRLIDKRYEELIPCEEYRVAPTVDAVQMAPVKIERYDNGQGRCPLCKTDIPFQVVNDKWAFELYCPHCGVRMNLEDDAK